jgi:hypothetical protein
MADQARSSGVSGFADKGKGKAVNTHEDVEMGEDDSEEDESGDDFEVRIPPPTSIVLVILKIY